MESTELVHYGVKGMRWGVRKKYYGAGTEGFVPKKPKGEQPSYMPKKSERQKRWEDDHGFNPHRPNGTPRKKTSIETKIESKIKMPKDPQKSKKLNTAAAYGTIAVASFLMAYGAKTIADARRGASTRMLEKTLEYVNVANRYYS